MTKEELFRAVGEVREEQITDAETVRKQSRPWRRYGAMAACLAVVLAGAFALKHLQDARRWAALEESFQSLDTPESAAVAGSGADAGGLDGADYWTGGETCPAPNYSVNVEIGELQNSEGAKRGEIANGENLFSSQAASMDVAWLSPEEIFARDTVIFRGTVRGLRYYVVETGGFETQYTAAAVEITDPIRGDLAAGETRTVLYMGGPNVFTSLSGPLSGLEVGSDAIFMPIATTPETGRRDGDSYFCYADLGEFYLSEGMRYVFLDTGEGLAFERSAYEEIAEAETLDEVADYIREMTGTVQSRPADIPAEPQPDPSCTVQAANPSNGPAGARELPGGALIGDEEKD